MGFVAAQPILRFAIVAWVAATTSACALPQRVDGTDAAQSQPNTSESRRVYTDLIRSMLDQGQYYAALAHVQERRREGGDQGELRYLEAEARRGLGQVDAADALYRGLLRAPQAARAYHGLGLLHAGRDLERAIGYLGEAARRVPTDADVRNDLGYALLRSGRYPEALAELATAVELAPDSEKARNNLVLLLMVRGDEAAVARVAREAAVSAETLSRLRVQARALNTQKGSHGGSP